MSTTENTNERKVTLKPSSDSTIITPLTGLADEQPNETLITLGGTTPTEYSIKPAPPRDSSNSFNFVKHDNRSTEQRQKDYNNQREATIDRFKEALKANRPGSQVIAELDQDMSSEMIAEMMREAKNRLEKERTEAEEAREDRKAEFHRRLQERRAVCEYCHAVLGWDLYAEDRHLMNCSAYLEHQRAQEAYNQRRRNFTNRYDRLLNFTIPQSVAAVRDLVETINELKFIQAEAIYSDKDSAIREGLENVREKIQSESNYDRKSRQKQIASLRTAATTLESLYRRLYGEEEVEQQ